MQLQNNFFHYLNIISDYKLRKKKLKFVKIEFDTATFDRVIKDTSANFVDKLSAIGGTMGLLTGFSIISGVEIIYFAVRIVINIVKQFVDKRQNKF